MFNYNMSERKVRKRTRSEKGKALDENLAKSNSKSPTAAKRARSKSNASRRIIFTDDNEQVNDNATRTTRAKITNLMSNQDKKVEHAKVDNVKVRKKGKMGRTLKELEETVVEIPVELREPDFKKAKVKMIQSFQASKLKDGVKNGGLVDPDGINLDVEADSLDDLDYVDNIIPDEEELSDIETEMETETCPPQQCMERRPQAFVVETVAKEIVPRDSSARRMMQQSKRSAQIAVGGPSTSSAPTAVNLTREELAKLPQVKDMFEQFFEEKMKQMNAGKNFKIILLQTENKLN